MLLFRRWPNKRTSYPGSDTSWPST